MKPADSGPALRGLSDEDVDLFIRGEHRSLYRCLGAHLGRHADSAGVWFAVWAPTAEAVSVVGDFNAWDSSSHPMGKRGGGLWELFVPEIARGALYKFAVRARGGHVQLKADPFGQQMELRPGTASVVTQRQFTFSDETWRDRRAEGKIYDHEMAVYEAHLGSWRQHQGPRKHAACPNWLGYRELAHSLVDYVADLGFTHLELMPIMEYPLDGSWGYQATGYFAPSSRYGTPDDFRYLVNRCHERGLGLLLDWVPAHFPKDAFGLARFDGGPLYEHPDPRMGEHRQWGTYVFDYARPEVQQFLINSALFWLDEFHVDGLRVDAVASMLYLDYGSKHPDDWLPNEHGGRENRAAVAFLQRLNDVVHAEHPGAIMIAEESTAWPGVTAPTAEGGLGFDLKWNMGWMHDSLSYFSKDPVYRQHHQDHISFGLSYAFTERFMLPLSHDEVVHLKRSLLDKMPGDRWQKMANLRALYAHMWAHPGKKLLFMGGELGQWTEWNENESLPWELLERTDHAGVQRLVGDLNAFYRRYAALHADHEAEGFKWIAADDAGQSVFAYLRLAKAKEDERDGQAGAAYLISVANFTPVPRHGYRIGVPRACVHREILNTDAEIYGGSGVGNLGSVMPQAVPAHGYAQSIELSLPPLAVLWLAPTESGR